MKKRVLALVCVLLLVLSVFAGCGDTGNHASENSGTEETSNNQTGEINFDEEPYEINYLYLVAQEGANQSKVSEAVNDLALTEVNMSVNLIPMTFGTYAQQLSMMLAANEPLDILPVMSTDYSTYIEAQYLTNAADYLEYASDILEVLGEDANAGYLGDFLVGFGQMKERAFPAGLVVRKDIFDELGYQIGDFNVTTEDYSTYEQITDMFSAVKQAYPDVVMFDGNSTMAGQTISYVDNIGSEFGVLENYGQTKTVTNWFESEQYQTFCKISREWFTSGYASKDIAVNQESGEIKMKSGNCFSYLTVMKPNSAVEKLAQTGYEVEIIPLSDAVKKTSAVNGSLIAIANASESPEKAMQFMNWTYKSGAFNDLINWGIEGEDWVETQDGMAAYPDGIDANNVGYHNDYGWAYPNQFAGHPWTGNPSDIWEQYQAYNDGLMISEAFGFTFDPRDIAEEEIRLNVVYEKYFRDLSFGAVEVEETLQKFNDELYAAGLQTVIDEKQRQFDEWLAAQ